VQRTSSVSWQPTRIGSLPRRRVLYVESDAFRAALVEATLADAAVEVHWTSSGRSAITTALAPEYDAYLVGVGTRGMNPVAVVDELARRDDRVPIIRVADEPRSWRRDVTIVRKPFVAGELLAAVEAACQSDAEAA
jgi:DNA-binding response OmpR family regulator